MSSPSILVVGAGAAGVAAATKLYEHGFRNVTVVEAENRIGGRVLSAPFAGSVIDIGGQWVEGRENNVVYEMFKDTDMLKPSNMYRDFTFFDSEGAMLDKQLTDKIVKIAFGILHDKSEAEKHTGSFGDYFNERFPELVKKEFENYSKIALIAKLISEWVSKFFLLLDSGVTWYEVAAKGALTIMGNPEEEMLNWAEKGYITALKLMMKNFPEKNIELNTEVKKIKWDAPEGGSDSIITVECSNGTFNVNHCIVTVSVGVLQKYHKTMFEPNLPPLKIKTIENITPGEVMKILLKFPKKWWPDGFTGVNFCWKNSPNKLEVPDFEPSHDGKSWIEDIVGFYTVDHLPDVLLGWLVGPFISQVEQLSDDVIVKNCTWLLRKFTGGKYDIPDPETILKTQWVTNPHFLGTHSIVSVKEIQSGVKREDLASPVTDSNGKEVLLFAGEAAHPSQYSCVHGAVASGYREADRLIEFYKRK